MALTDAEQTRLDELRTAKHSLLTGKRVSSVEYEGETLTFSKVDMERLDREIAALEAKEGGTTTMRRPFSTAWDFER